MNSSSPADITTVGQLCEFLAGQPDKNVRIYRDVSPVVMSDWRAVVPWGMEDGRAYLIPRVGARDRAKISVLLHFFDKIKPEVAVGILDWYTDMERVPGWVRVPSFSLLPEPAWAQDYPWGHGPWIRLEPGSALASFERSGALK